MATAFRESEVQCFLLLPTNPTANFYYTVINISSVLQIAIAYRNVGCTVGEMMLIYPQRKEFFHSQKVKSQKSQRHSFTIQSSNLSNHKSHRRKREEKCTEIRVQTFEI